MSQVTRDINNLQAQISNLTKGSVVSVLGGTNVTITGSAQYPVVNVSGVASGVSSLTAGGAGLLVSPSTGDVIIKNTGVTSLTAGTGVSVSNTSGDITINNTGITSLTAGSGIAVRGSTITNSGVLSLTAGTNTTITGTSQNPVINAVNPVIPSGSSINVGGLSYDFATNPSLLANCIIYSSVPLASAGITINFPTYAQLVSTYGANAVIPFTVGNMNQQTPQEVVYLTVTGDSSPVSCFFNQSVVGGAWVANTKQPSTTTFYLTAGNLWRGTVVLDSVLQHAYYCFTWMTNL